MAKQKLPTIPTYSSNSALIQGAGAAYGSQNTMLPGIKINTDVINAVIANTEKKKKENEEAIAKTETRISNYLGQMEYFDTNVVPDVYLPQVQNKLMAYKNEYFNVSNELAKLKPTDPAYQDLSIRLSEINSGIRGLSNTFIDQRKNKDADALMFDKNINKLSVVNDSELVEGIDAILRNEAEMQIDDRGVVRYKLKGEWVRYEDIPELVAKDTTVSTAVGGWIADLSTKTTKEGITPAELKDYEIQLNNYLDDKNTVLSLANDKFLGVGLFFTEEELTDEEGNAINTLEYSKELKALVFNKYMGMIKSAASDGQKRNMDIYNKALEDSRNRGTGDDTRYTNPNVNTASNRLNQAIAATPAESNPQSFEGLRIEGTADTRGYKGTASWNADNVVIDVQAQLTKPGQSNRVEAADWEKVTYINNADGSTSIVYPRGVWNAIYGGNRPSF